MAEVVYRVTLYKNKFIFSSYIGLWFSNILATETFIIKEQS